MSHVQQEIAELEEQLRLAELGPDAGFFQDMLADDAVMVADGESSFAKEIVVEAHRPGRAPKFTQVDMSEMQILDHGAAAVVTCQGTYHTEQSKTTLKFMRVWVRKSTGWQIVAASVSAVS